MNEKNLQLVTFEQAKALKDLGFNWYVNQSYSTKGWLSGCVDYDDYNLPTYSEEYSIFSAPTVALALKWCRDVKKIKNEVRFYYSSNTYESYYYQGYYDIKNHIVLFLTEHYDTYEAAESELLDEIIKYLKSE